MARLGAAEDGEEAAELTDAMEKEFGGDSRHFYPGVSYRHVFVGRGLDARHDCAPPPSPPCSSAISCTRMSRRPTKSAIKATWS